MGQQAMNALCDNQLAPITFSIGFIETPIQMVADKAVAWWRSIHSSVDVSAIKSSLRDALVRLEPLMTPPRKYLLISTGSPWVAYFDNGTSGPDPAGFVGYMSERLKCRGLVVTCKSIEPPRGSGPEGRRSATIRFVLYAGEPREWLNVERSLSVVNDYGDWTFKATGTVQPFERPDHYFKRRIKDRFTSEMLVEYCAALGIHLFDEDFYGPDGLVVTINDSLPTEFIPQSLAEARARLGLKP